MIPAWKSWLLGLCAYNKFSCGVSVNVSVSQTALILSRACTSLLSPRPGLSYRFMWFPRKPWISTGRCGFSVKDCWASAVMRLEFSLCETRETLGKTAQNCSKSNKNLDDANFFNVLLKEFFPTVQNTSNYVTKYSKYVMHTTLNRK